MPPLVGVAVKVTVLPRQNGLDEAEILTLTTRFGLTVIVIVFDVAGFPVAHARLDVSAQEIISPFAGI